MRGMATKSPTTVIALRTPNDLAEAIKDEATRRNLSVSELLNLDLAAIYKRGSSVRKMLKESHDADDSLGGAFS